MEMDTTLAPEGGYPALEHFLAWQIPTTLAFAVLQTAAAGWFHSTTAALLAALIWGYGAVTLLARAEARRGNEQTAVDLISTGLLVAAVGAAAIQPALFPTLAVVPLLAVAVALPHRPVARLRRLIALSWIVTVAVTLAGWLLPRRAGTTDWFFGLLLSASLSATVALVLLLLWQFSSRLSAARETVLEASRLKSEFLANMSHEIRTPMNAVIGMTRLLAETELTRDQREYAEMIRCSGNALLGIINDVLDFSKVEAGKLELEAIDFDLRAGVEEVVASFAEAASRKRLELACLVHHDVPAALRGDPTRLRQVLTNLVGNAVKFTERGEVVVRASLVEERDGVAAVRFDVTDTGIGIAPESQARLFQSFSQANGSTTRKYGGTGLGLAISKRLVEMMGGVISLESQPGRGSAFYFTARLARAEAERTAATPEADIRGLRVLIVDDSDTNRTILRQQLASWGVLTEDAPDALTALERLRSASVRGEPYDVAVLDLRMPDVDGLALARHIKGAPVIAAVRLVLLTSVGWVGEAAEASRSGIAGYLTKPVRESHLRDCLAAVMGLPATTPAQQIVTRHSLDECRARGFARVLVAEDNEMNQVVAVRTLEKLGYKVDLARCGREALEACSRTGYAAVLMDCQMPGMDGYEATAQIRKSEGGRRRTPIIAMTASALAEDRERCLAAGMDDYISKPVRLEELGRTLLRWIPPTRPAFGRKASHAADPASREPLDRVFLDDLRALGCAGGEPILNHLIDSFLRDTPATLSGLREAALEGDAVALERQAHGLKGSCGILGARGMAHLCGQVEEMGRTGRTGGAGQLLDSLATQYAALRPLLISERRREVAGSEFAGQGRG